MDNEPKQLEAKEIKEEGLYYTPLLGPLIEGQIDLDKPGWLTFINHPPYKDMFKDWKRLAKER